MGDWNWKRSSSRRSPIRVDISIFPPTTENSSSSPLGDDDDDDEEDDDDEGVEATAGKMAAATTSSLDVELVDDDDEEMRGDPSLRSAGGDVDEDRGPEYLLESDGGGGYAEW